MRRAVFVVAFVLGMLGNIGSTELALVVAAAAGLAVLDAWRVARRQARR